MGPLQLPTSHVVPGGSGSVGQFPYMGFAEPPTLIPASFLAEIVRAMNAEFAMQGRFIGDQYSSVVGGYHDMNKRFESYVHGTDKILAEQNARFEQRLDNIRKDMRQLHENQMAAIADLRHGLDGLAATIKNVEHVARDPPSFESTTPAGGMSLEAFSNLLKLTDGPSCAGDAKFESWIDYTHAEEEAPTPAAQSQTESEVDVNAVLALTNCSSVEPGGREEEQRGEPTPVPASPSTSSRENPEIEEQDQLYEWGTPRASTPSTEAPLVSPTMDTGDAVVVPASPSMAPETIPTTPTQNQNMLQDPLFDAPSPLTPISSSSLLSQDERQPSTAFSEDATPTPHPTSSNTTGRKRKRASSRRGVVKGSRRGRKRQSQENWGAAPNLIGFSEGSYTDTSIWPSVVEDGPNSQKYVECERCAKWFHFGCAGLQGDHEDGFSWVCPLCILDPKRDAYIRREVEEMCSRPGCTISQGGEFFMSQLLGRCYVPDQNVIKYLVAYDGYPVDQCTWEPPDSFSNDSSRIDEFLEWWTTENPGIDIESLDPHETIFLKEAYALARVGVTWPGA